MELRRRRNTEMSNFFAQTDDKVELSLKVTRVQGRQGGGKQSGS